MMKGYKVSEQMTDLIAAVATFTSKLLPAGLGALAMAAVDLPETKREMFFRIFVAFVFSWAFYGFSFDFLHSFQWFAFMDKTNEDHQFAVRALLGAGGFFIMGAGAQFLKRFRADPVGTVKHPSGDSKPS